MSELSYWLLCLIFYLTEKATWTFQLWLEIVLCKQWQWFHYISFRFFLLLLFVVHKCVWCHGRGSRAQPTVLNAFQNWARAQGANPQRSYCSLHTFTTYRLVVYCVYISEAFRIHPRNLACSVLSWAHRLIIFLKRCSTVPMSIKPLTFFLFIQF